MKSKLNHSDFKSDSFSSHGLWGKYLDVSEGNGCALFISWMYLFQGDQTAAMATSELTSSFKVWEVN